MVSLTEFLKVNAECELYKLAESLCQKSVNGKRLITDVAVSKIPYAVYPDMSIQQSLVIHELAEYLLQTAKNRNDSNEIAITCDIAKTDITQGTVRILEQVGVCYGSQNETDLWSDSNTASIISRAKDITIVNLHNHPSCSTFSINDISIFLRETALKMMVIVGNDGELYYMSKNMNAYDYGKAKGYLMQASMVVDPDIVKKEFVSFATSREIADLFLKNCGRLGIEYRHVLGTDKTLRRLQEDSISEVKETKENDDVSEEEEDEREL
jgi:hypothetical protein